MFRGLKYAFSIVTGLFLSFAFINGQVTGGAVTGTVTVTKSGTNHYHGSVFTYIDSQKLNASTTESDRQSKDYFRQARKLLAV